MKKANYKNLLNLKKVVYDILEKSTIARCTALVIKNKKHCALGE